MNRRTFCAAFAAPVGLSLQSCGSVQVRPTDGFHPPDEEFIASLPRLMDVAMLPGVGIGMVTGQRPVWSHYAGTADAEAGSPINADSVFPGCSLGKPLFAYAVLRLEEAGRLDLDIPLSEYLSTDPPTGEFGRKVTARHVLSHSTGFVNWRQAGDERLISAFEPGTRFQYSGEGFYTLQRTVEAITGTGFEQFMQDSVFGPLGMRSSTFLWIPEAEGRFVWGHNSVRRPNRSFWDFNKRLSEIIARSDLPLSQWNHERIVGAMATGDRQPMPNEISPNVAFSLFTTIEDYSRFVARLAAPAGDALDLRDRSRALLMTPSTRVNSSLSWGLGIGIENQAGRNYLWQWGDNGLWKDFLVVDPTEGSAVFVFTNGSNGMRVAERIVAASTDVLHDAFLWA